ncbi:hypothetical protein D3C71_1631800 [compost metagenome]
MVAKRRNDVQGQQAVQRPGKHVVDPYRGRNQGGVRRDQPGELQAGEGHGHGQSLGVDDDPAHEARREDERIDAKMHRVGAGVLHAEAVAHGASARDAHHRPHQRDRKQRHAASNVHDHHGAHGHARLRRQQMAQFTGEHQDAHQADA